MDWLVVRVDPQRRSVWLRDGTRLGFAAARRAGIDVEAAQMRLEGRGR
jgi:hypothetical protein